MRYYIARVDAYDAKAHRALIKTELLTERERKQYTGLSDRYFKKMTINKNHTYQSFACRLVKHEYRSMYGVPNMNN